MSSSGPTSSPCLRSCSLVDGSTLTESGTRVLACFGLPAFSLLPPDGISCLFLCCPSLLFSHHGAKLQRYFDFCNTKIKTHAEASSIFCESSLLLKAAMADDGVLPQALALTSSPEDRRTRERMLSRPWRPYFTFTLAMAGETALAAAARSERIRLLFVYCITKNICTKRPRALQYHNS